MNYYLNKIIFFIFLSFFFSNCTKDNASKRKAKAKMLQEICKDRQNCSGVINCNGQETCIKDLCNTPVCISTEDACKAACGNPDCAILESNPSLVSCK